MPQTRSATDVPAIPDLDAEFDRQLQNLLTTGYPELAGMSPAAFTALVEPLRAHARGVPVEDDPPIPFVLVVPAALVAPEVAIDQVEVDGKQGFTEMDHDELATFRPIASVEVPDAPVYLVTDVGTGREFFDVRPRDALPTILAAGRSPLTIDEGMAVLTQFPEVLAGRTRDCFSMLASRSTDKRVTAMWMSKGRPRLGWCFDGAPHTWLGSASCASRLGA